MEAYVVVNDAPCGVVPRQEVCLGNTPMAMTHASGWRLDPLEEKTTFFGYFFPGGGEGGS